MTDLLPHSNLVTFYGKMMTFSRIKLATDDFEIIESQLATVSPKQNSQMPIVIDSDVHIDLQRLVDLLWDWGLQPIGVVRGVLDEQAEAMKIALFPADGKRVNRISNKQTQKSKVDSPKPSSAPAQSTTDNTQSTATKNTTVKSNPTHASIISDIQKNNTANKSETTEVTQEKPVSEPDTEQQNPESLETPTLKTSSESVNVETGTNTVVESTEVASTPIQTTSQDSTIPEVDEASQVVKSTGKTNTENTQTNAHTSTIDKASGDISSKEVTHPDSSSIDTLKTDNIDTSNDLPTDDAELEDPSKSIITRALSEEEKRQAEIDAQVQRILAKSTANTSLFASNTQSLQTPSNPNSFQNKTQKNIADKDSDKTLKSKNTLTEAQPNSKKPEHNNKSENDTLKASDKNTKNTEADKKQSEIERLAEEKIKRFSERAEAIAQIKEAKKQENTQDTNQALQKKTLKIDKQNNTSEITSKEQKQSNTVKQTTATALKSREQTKVRVEHMGLHPEEDDGSRVHHQVLRSGQSLNHVGGDLILTNSVNDGAEAITDNSLHIYGRGMGRLVAGATGNNNAQIFCQQFNPSLVSIAGTYMLRDNLPPEVIDKSVQVSYKEKEGLVFKIMDDLINPTN